jgi:hypothetical protein
MPQTFYPTEVNVENKLRNSASGAMGENPLCPADHGAAFSVALKDTHDGLRGFEICDPDGYVLFFGRPR